MIIITILVGSFFVGITAVQGTVQKQPFNTVSYFDYNVIDPGTTMITGNWATHIFDNINSFTFIEGPIEGSCVNYAIVTNYNDLLGIGEGIIFSETVGTWIGDDEFYGLPVYCYGRGILRKDGPFGYVGTVNFLGTLGDYKIHITGDSISYFDFTTFMFYNSISGEIAIIS